MNYKFFEGWTMENFWIKPPKNRICSVQMKDEHCAEYK